MEYVAPLIAALVGAAGGILAWRKRADDKKAGLENREAAREEAIRADWKAFAAEMREALDDERAARKQLEARVSELSAKVDSLRTSYWRAIQHIRELYGYINRYRTDDQPEPPQAPESLINDL